ncbi:MAG TPA: hypothetical protein VFB32_17890, partial [Rudaea sp.]|nr:hypothetical protein [Rudaea sp.]
YCSGEFSSGDRIYIAFMGADGGQYAVATAATHFDSVTLHALLGPLHADAQQRVRTCADDTIIVREADVEWLWPPA